MVIKEIFMGRVELGRIFMVSCSTGNKRVAGSIGDGPYRFDKVDHNLKIVWLCDEPVLSASVRASAGIAIINYLRQKGKGMVYGACDRA